MRWLGLAFWIFIGGMLLWQFFDYNESLNKQVIANPPPQHYFFFDTNALQAPKKPAAKPVVDGPNVVQKKFWVKYDEPNPGMFTCYVVVKNIGNAKATNVQLLVRPYRGISLGDDDDGHAKSHVVTDTDALAQISQWITFPDLAPGQASDPGTASFLSSPGAAPGGNPDPEISFDRVKP